PFFPAGASGLFQTAAIVFVSYAGVTKVASVAEEVTNPYRILPVAMIGSLLLMMFVYPAITYVMVGVTPPETLAGDLTPLATAAEQVFPDWAVTAFAAVGVLALASMANAGLLASSRYPFAMARRKLAPSVFARVGERSGTPTLSVILTGALLIGLVLWVPVFELAKLASAFQLLMFAMINLAQIAFRSSKLWWYKPKFEAPGYPYVPILGMTASLLLITQLGLVPILGAVGIIVAGLVWYQVYGRSRAIKESAFRESVRQQGRSRLLNLIEASLDDSRRIAVISDDPKDTSSLLRVGRSLTGEDSDADLITMITDGDERDLRLAENDPGVIVSMLGDGHLPVDRDVVALNRSDIGDINVIAVLGSGGPFDVLKISLAARMAKMEGATVRFIHVLDPSSSRGQVRFIEQLHAEIGERLDVPTQSMVIESMDLLTALTSAASDADLAIVGAATGRHFFTEIFDRIVERIDPPVLLVRVADKGESSAIRTFFDRLVSSRLSQSDATHDNQAGT
ncbi:MAG: amino acid permease, partial [Acidimicrobiia bacterium]